MAKHSYVLPSTSAPHFLAATDAPSLLPIRQWFAVQTTARHEKRVFQHLEIRQLESFLPLYKSACTWKDGSKVSLDLPLFPNYIFVHIEIGDRVRVLEVPGVLSIVRGTARGLAALPDIEMGLLRDGLPLYSAEPHSPFVTGQRVRICHGSLTGMEGVLIRKNSATRVVLTIALIMQSISVEIDPRHLVSLGPDLPLTFAS